MRYYILLFLLFPSLSYASSDIAITFTQDYDCHLVDHWLIETREVGATGEPTIVGEIKTNCAAEMTSTQFIQGIGPYSFTLRAVSADGALSNPSNTVETTIPLAVPVLLKIEAQ